MTRSGLLGSEHAQLSSCPDLTWQVLARGGLGDETYLPEGVMAQPPNINMKTAREEAHMVLFSCGEAQGLRRLLSLLLLLLLLLLLEQEGA